MLPACPETECATPLSRPHPFQAGDMLFDRPPHPGMRGYELEEEIGTGAFGVIYRAVQTAVSREDAVKIIRRFEAEAQMVARLEHPTSSTSTTSSANRAARILSCACSGPAHQPASGRLVAKAHPPILGSKRGGPVRRHQCGIIHRDIKPANILFDNDGNAHLSDSGIAKGLHQPQPLTAQDNLVGPSTTSRPNSCRRVKLRQSAPASKTALLVFYQ